MIHHEVAMSFGSPTDHETLSFSGLSFPRRRESRFFEFLSSLDTRFRGYDGFGWLPRPTRLISKEGKKSTMGRGKMSSELRVLRALRGE
jgi:hypothetical protein